MNVLTRKIKDKGYSLGEFCKLHDFVIRTYRRHEKPSHPKHETLVSQVNELENKNGTQFSISNQSPETFDESDFEALDYTEIGKLEQNNEI